MLTDARKLVSIDKNDRKVLVRGSCMHDGTGAKKNVFSLMLIEIEFSEVSVDVLYETQVGENESI